MSLHDLQMICVGIMLAITPSMLVVAVALMRAPTVDREGRYEI